MFDLGLDKISSIITSKSEYAFKDLMAKLSISSHQQNQLKNSITRTSSRLSSNNDQQVNKKKLQDRKLKLLKQLQSIDHEIHKTNIEKSRIETRKKTQTDYVNTEALNRAADLVGRMNQKRKQQSIAHKKEEEKIQIRVQYSLKKFKELQQIQQKQKEERRLKIQERISKRKQNLKILNQYSKKSNHLIQQLQNYRLSLPIINNFKNPQQKGNQTQTKTEVKKESPTIAFPPKLYPKSSFWEHIQKQEINKKRQQYIKSFEKKKIRERQQVYGKKVRKNLKQSSSLFVTD